MVLNCLYRFTEFTLTVFRSNESEPAISRLTGRQDAEEPEEKAAKRHSDDENNIEKIFSTQPSTAAVVAGLHNDQVNFK